MKKPTALTDSIMNELFPRRLSKGDRKRIQILGAAVKMYAKLRIEDLPVEDIARLAKISRPLLQHYYPDKKVLFLNAMKLVRAQFQDLAIRHLQNAKTPRERIICYIESTFEWYRVNPVHVKSWILFFQACANDPEIKAEHSRMTRMGQERIIAMLKDGRYDGDLALKAKSIQRIITGALMEIVTEENFDLDIVQSQTVKICLDLVER